MTTTTTSTGASKSDQHRRQKQEEDLHTKPMTGWKGGLEFQPQDRSSENAAVTDKATPTPTAASTSATGTGTTSRMRRRLHHTPTKSKGGFQKKNKVSMAPDLLAVVSMKPEMKERAKVEAKARILKLEERRKQKHKNNMTSRTVITKPKHTPSKEWTNMLKKSPSDGGSADVRPLKGFKKKSAAPADANAKISPAGGDCTATTSSATVTTTPISRSKPKVGTEAREDSPVVEIPKDWTAVYQDIISPTSGKHRAVAKQDLDIVNAAASASHASAAAAARGGDNDDGEEAAAPTRVRSPKKKSRSLSPVLRVRDNGDDGRGGAGGNKSTLPGILPLDLCDDDDDVVAPAAGDNDAAGTPSKSTQLKRASFSSIKTPISIDTEHLEDEYPIDDLPEQKPMSPSYPAADKSKDGKQVTADDKDDYEDYEEYEDDLEFEDASEQPDDNDNVADELIPPVVHHDVIRSDEEFEMEQQQSSDYRTEVWTSKKEDAGTFDDNNKGNQLILEFSIGDGGTGEDNGGLQVPIEVLSFDELSSVDSWPSIDSEDSYETKMNKMMQRWVDIDGGNDGYHQGTAKSAAYVSTDITLDDNVLDHIVLAAPDLEEAVQQFEDMTGIVPTHVGPLQGLGAQTAHVGLDNNRYIEILAPDEDNPGPLGDELKKLKESTLVPYHYSIRSSEVSRLIEGYVYDVLGWDPDHISMVQALPDGSVRQWDLLTTYGHDMGGCAPYYVKWNDPARHPTASIPINATLVACTVRAPEDHDVHKLIAGVGGINVQCGQPMLECMLSTPKGTVSFSASRPKGLVFPGYEDEQMITESVPEN